MAAVKELIGDGIDCEQIVFIDVDTTGLDGDGSATNPYNALTNDIIENASALIVMTNGSQTLSQPLVLKNGIHIVGGFERSSTDEWSYDPTGNSRTHIDVVASNGTQDTIGVWAEGITDTTALANIRVTSSDARPGTQELPNGLSSIGLYIKESSGLFILNTEIESGRGGDGANGARGNDGPDGVMGEDGTPTTNRRNPGTSWNATFLRADERILSPLGASNPACDPTAGETSGGDAGLAGGACGPLNGTGDYTCPINSTNTDGRNDPAYPVTDGEDGAGALGGAGATSVRLGRHKYPLTMPYNADNGAHGQAASTMANDGNGGNSGGVFTSSTLLERRVWTPTGEGEDGEQGQNGGGGGGGGSFEYVNYDDGSATWQWGAQGGAGGSGGCAGDGGQGGGSGGASIGLVAEASVVTLIDSRILAKPGGDGGTGGSGGAGGAGGTGGAGSNELHLHQYPTNALDQIETYGARSGRGGDGGSGTSGGDGGGGAGGVSYGAFCSESSLTIRSTEIISGGRSNGGGSSDTKGQNGLSFDIEACM